MATVNKTRIWQNITITEEIDTSSGKMVLKNSAGTTLSTSEKNDWNWVVSDLSTFTRNYNSLNTSTNKTEEEFTQFFYVEGVPIFNKDRSDVINDRSSYGLVQDYNLNASSLFELGVPGVRNPKSGLKVSSKGRKTTQNTRGQTPQTNTLRSDETNPPNDLRETPNSNVFQAGLRSAGSSARSASRSITSLMRYPSAEFSDGGSDFIQITGHKYEAPKLSSNTSYDDLLTPERLGEATGTVILPIQPSISESSSVNWGGDKLSAISGTFAAAAAGAIDAGAKLLTGDGAGAGEGAKTIMSNFLDSARDLAKTPGATDYLKAYFAGQAVGSNNLAARATGQVINQNLELLFEGPNLRTFNFSFPLTPRDDGEAQTIKDMIRFFKKNMSPYVQESKLFLYTPNIFKLEYVFQGGEHPFLNKIKPCALTTFDVQYTPGNSYSTYDDGSMTQYTLTLGFSEITPIYQNDQDAAGGTGY